MTTPSKRRKTNEGDDRPRAVSLLAQAPAAVRATITVLANSPSPRQPQRRPAPPATTAPVPEPEPSPEPEEAPAAPSRTKTKRKKSSKRKALTSKGKRAVVMKVLASVEAEKREAAAAAATNTAATNTATAPVPDEATKNLGKAWIKEDLAKLARLAEDRDYLLATIPDYPEPQQPGGTGNAAGDLDWELISSHFGRYSKGGVAVRQQYYAVVRLMKQARKEGKNGSNYVDLVKQALSELPNNQGTVFEIHAVLKKGHAKHLDKYKVKGQVRWKKAVGEVLRQETSIFEAVEKTESGKIIWKLK